MRYLTLVLSHVLDIGYTFFPVSTRQFRSLGCLLLSQLGGPSSSSKKHTQSPVLGHHSFEETLLATKKRYTISGFLLCRRCWFEDIGKQKNKRKICHRKTFRESIQLLAFPQRFNTNPNWGLVQTRSWRTKVGCQKSCPFFWGGQTRTVHLCTLWTCIMLKLIITLCTHLLIEYVWNIQNYDIS